MSYRFFSLLFLIPSYLLAELGYVTNYANNTVSVFDTETNLVTATIVVGSSPDGIIIVNGVGYVANSGSMSNIVSVFDTSNNQLLTPITVDTSPTYFGIEGTHLFVLNFAGGMGNGSVNVIDTTNNTVIATINDASFNGPTGIAITNNTAYVTNWGSTMDEGGGTTLTVIDTLSYAVTDVITIPSVGPYAVAIYETNAYTANNTFPGDVTVINTLNNTVVATITASSSFNYPIDIAVSGSSAYVTNNGGSTISVIDLTNNTVTNTITVSPDAGSGPAGITILGNIGYVANYNTNAIGVVNLLGGGSFTNTISDPSFDGPSYIAFPAGSSTSQSRAFQRPSNRR